MKRPLGDTSLYELLLMRTMFLQMKSGLVNDTVMPFLEERILAVKPHEKWEGSEHQKIAKAMIAAAEEWENSRFGSMFVKKNTWKSIKTLIKHRHTVPELLAEKSDFWNTAEAQDIAAFAMSLTSLKVFTGGVGKEENRKTSRKILKRGGGVIIDVPAPEKYDTPPTDAVFNGVIAMYLDALDLCGDLKKEFPEGKIAAAFKLSTVANFDDLERISKKIKEHEEKEERKGEKEPLNLGDDQAVYDKILARMEKFLTQAAEMKIDAYVDAEESVINPIINHMCFQCLEKTAKEPQEKRMRPIITVQAYLVDSKKLVDKILGMENPPDIKLVRGAYIGAARQPREDIWYNADSTISKKLTDDNYNNLLRTIYNPGKIRKLIVATHNQESRDIIEELKREGMKNGNQTEVELATLMGVGANLKPADPNLHMTEMKYQPALMQKLAAAVLGFMAYFTRRGKEFMDQPGEEKSRSRADEELEAVDRELEIRGYSMDIVDDLQHRLSLFINRQLEHMGAKASAAIT